MVRTAVRAAYTHPASVGVLYYRLGQVFLSLKLRPLGALAYSTWRVFYPLVRIYSGLELLPRTEIGPGLKVLHSGPVVIHPGVVAGEHLTIAQFATFGEAKSGVPAIGDRVSVGSGAVVIGGITVGSDSHIGANAVVTRDVSANTTVVGVPAKTVPREADR